MSIGPGDTCFLIDCSSFVHRDFHSAALQDPAYSYNERGEPIGALKKFATRLYYWRKFGAANRFPNFMGAVYDAGRRTFRHALYDGYKANRHETPDELKRQMPLVREVAEALGIRAVEMDGYEADDLIGVYALTAVEAGADCLIVSGDKDFGGLVRPGITLFDPAAGVEGFKGYRPERIINHDEVVAMFGVPPHLVYDVQGLAGDSTDGIPGVPGIGLKTAASLIQQFGSLEGVLANAHQVTQPKRRQALIDYADQARLSYKLAKLDDCCDYDVPLDDMLLDDLDYDRAISFCEQHGLTRLSERLRHDAKKS